MTDNVEHLKMLLAICVTFFSESFFSSALHNLKVGILGFLLLSWKSYLYILGIGVLSYALYL